MQRIPSLDGLRALSILFVLAGHLNLPPRTISHHLSLLGVKIFFVISGFLITLILDGKKQRNSFSFADFYFRRALRLMPAFYAYLLVLALFTVAGFFPLHPKDFAFAAFYLMNYYPHGGPWAVGHFWSLSVEEQFYLLWPVLFLFLASRPAIRVLIAAILLAPLTRLALLPWQHALGPTYGTMFPAVCDSLAVGCLLALTRTRLHQLPRYLAILRSGTYLLALPLALLLELTLPARLAPLGASLVNFAVVLLIDGCITFPHFWFGKLLNTPPLRFIGVMSYSIYLWQQPFLNHEQHAPWTRFPLNLILALTCATISYFCIERPFLALRSSRSPEPAPAPADASLTSPGLPYQNV